MGAALPGVRVGVRRFSPPPPQAAIAAWYWERGGEPRAREGGAGDQHFALERGLALARVGKELALAWRRPAFILSWPQAPPRSSCAAFAKLEWFFAGLTTLFFVRQFR